MKSKFAAVLLLSSCITASALAISAGPGGRMFTVGTNETLVGLQVFDIPVASDWLAGTSHLAASLKEKQVYASHHYRQTFQPNFVKHAGTGYGTITLGMWGLSAPVSANPKNTPRPDGDPNADASPVMNIVQVTPWSSTKLVGSGCAFHGPLGGIDGSGTLPSTDGGMMAWYDRSGLLTGTKGQYYYEGMWGWDMNWGVLKNTPGDTDITSPDSDWAVYQNRIDGNGYYPNGYAQQGDRLYGQWPGGFPRAGYDYSGRKMFYTQVANNTMTQKLWYDDSDDGSKPKMTDLSVAAPAKVTINGVVREAVFTFAYVQNELCIVRTVDADGDGDANDPSEVTKVFGNNNPAVAGQMPAAITEWAAAAFSGTSAMQFVRGPKGVNFLVWNNARYGQLNVIELNPDGTFKGSNAGVDPASCYTNVTVPDIKSFMNLDYYVPGDANGDYLVNGQDIYGFLKALAGEAAFWADPLLTNTRTIAGSDVNEDGLINGQDIKPFLDALAGTATAAPEPVSLVLLGLGGLGLLRRRK